MLRSLYIQNYALIEKLDIDFGSGFSVITGETGAGKSIILGAIGLLLGQRADVKSIRRGAAKCVIEARFEIAGYGMQPFFEENELEYEDECILRREVYASGKSRAFINDTPASLVQMKELGEQLIDVHSQHQNLLLNKEGFQLSVLDLLAHDEDELSKYRSLHREWKQVQQDLEQLVAQAEKNKADEDYIRFQLEQLEDAHLAAGEQEELEQEADTLSHAEEIKAGLFRAGQAMNSDEGGLLSVLKECLNTMAGLQKVYPAAGELAERLESSYIELKDISQGADTVNFLFSANKNGALQNISSVASGGEIARVMLSVKAMIAGAVKLPTIVFDEIDTGVSGEIADRMADIMQEMGDSDRQVISITHLPQIAARGRAHYKVYKQDNETETNSHIRRLTDEERVGEIAHMLSGATLTDAALNNAKALLGIV